MKVAKLPTCPKCGCKNLTKLDEHASDSVILSAMPKSRTMAYRCECGMAFVVSDCEESRCDPKSVLS